MKVAHNSEGQSQRIRARHSHLALLALLVIFMGVTLMYGQLNPLGEAPDEVAHMDLIRFIGDQGHLPRNDAERQVAGYKSDSPMLYHILIGATTSWIDYDVLPRLKVNDLSPRHILINDGLSPFAVIHTDDETPPFQGIVLAWRLARLASTLISAGTLVVTYFIVLRIRPDSPWLALGVAAVVAAIPGFHFIASSVNDDNLLGLLSALFILTLLLAWEHPIRLWIYVWLGLWFGLALTTKYTVVALFPLVLAVLARAIRRRELGWHVAAKRLLIFGATTIAVAAWWFIYVEWNFNKIKERGLLAGLAQPLSFDVSTERVASLVTRSATTRPGFVLSGDATFWDWATNLFRSFWFVPGEANATAVAAFSLAFLGLCILATAGLWRAWRRADNLPWPLLGLLALQVALLLPVPLIRFYLTRNPAEAGQGRHILFPAAVAVGLLLTLGVVSWFRPQYRRFIGPALAGVLLVVSLVSFFGFILPAFPPRLPVRTTSKALVEDITNSPGMLFSDTIELIGYEIGEVNQHAVLPVTLLWRSLEDVNQDYLVELSLVDQQGKTQGLWLGHPADGRYPTRAWEPDEVIRDTVWLPLTGIEGGDYRLVLHLQAANETDPPSSNKDRRFLADVTLPSVPARVPLHSVEATSKQSVGFDIWQTGQPVSKTPEYRYRAAIPITFSNLQSQTEICLVGPDGAEHSPLTQASNTHIFLVDAHWPSGDYRLRVKEADHQIDSEPILRAQVRPRNFDAPPMSTEVHANFGDEISLLGFDFPERRTQPGGLLPITLYWQALRPVSRHYIVSNHLLNSADLHQWGGRDRVPEDYYSTALWTPGEVVRDEYLVPVDPSAPPGVYRLDLGLYVDAAGQSQHLPLVQDGTALDANSVTIAPIKVGGPPPGVTTQNPAPQHPGGENLENFVTLMGYDMSLEPEALSLTLYWRSDSILPADYTTFVHVRDSTGQATGQPGTIVAQMDRQPADGAYPTSLWDPGEVIRDSIRVPMQAPVGSYEVVVGLYDLTTGKRLFVLNDHGEPIGDHIRLDEELILP